MELTARPAVMVAAKWGLNMYKDDGYSETTFLIQTFFVDAHICAEQLIEILSKLQYGNF